MSKGIINYGHDNHENKFNLSFDSRNNQKNFGSYGSKYLDS